MDQRKHTKLNFKILWKYWSWKQNISKSWDNAKVPSEKFIALKYLYLKNEGKWGEYSVQKSH